MIDLRRPNINGRTPEEKLSQIHSYLYQFVEQLEWAFNNLSESSSVSTAEKAVVSSANNTAINPASTFNAIKSLIIKSADIVDAYYEEMNERFAGEYVAESEFGTYSELTAQTIEKNSTGITQILANIQEISSDLEEIESALLAVNAYIKSGILEYDQSGFPIYGLEIGQRNVINGVETFNKYARFSADRLSFYDQNDTEVAYVSDYKLHITDVEIEGTLALGGYEIDTSNGLVFRWKGGS